MRLGGYIESFSFDDRLLLAWVRTIRCSGLCSGYVISLLIWTHIHYKMHDQGNRRLINQYELLGNGRHSMYTRKPMWFTSYVCNSLVRRKLLQQAKRGDHRFSKLTFQVILVQNEIKVNLKHMTCTLITLSSHGMEMQIFHSGKSAAF